MTTTDVLTNQDRLVLGKYLIEAGSKERQLETALQGQIALAQSPLLRHALQDHLVVTRRQIGAIDARVAELGAEDDTWFGVATAEKVVELALGAANRGMSLAKLPLQALRGTSPADNQLRCVRDCYWNEAEEIAHYRVIETVAAQLGDTETAKLAERHRQEEEEMQRHLEGLLPALVRKVVAQEATGAPAPPAPAASATPAKKRRAAASTTKPTGPRAKARA